MADKPSPYLVLASQRSGVEARPATGAETGTRTPGPISVPVNRWTTTARTRRERGYQHDRSSDARMPLT